MTLTSFPPQHEMKTSPLLLSVLGTSFAAAVILTSLYILNLKKKTGDQDENGTDTFSSLRRVRSCKDADLYKDVVCKEHPCDIPNLDTSTETSFTSFDTEEEDSRFTDTDCSLADADGQESSITLCHLSSHCANVNSVDNDSSIRITDDVSFQDILRSPIVERFSADDRMCQWSSCASPEPEIIHAFQETSPSAAELKIQNIYESYNRIVPPLLPNTGDTVCRDVHMQ